jgi:WD40 repeat protein
VLHPHTGYWTRRNAVNNFVGWGALIEVSVHYFQILNSPLAPKKIIEIGNAADPCSSPINWTQRFVSILQLLRIQCFGHSQPFCCCCFFVFFLTDRCQPRIELLKWLDSRETKDMWSTSSESSPSAISFASTPHDPNMLATSTEDGAIVVLDTASHVKVATKIPIHDNLIFDAKWITGSTNLVTVSSE